MMSKEIQDLANAMSDLDSAAVRLDMKCRIHIEVGGKTSLSDEVL